MTAIVLNSGISIDELSQLTAEGVFDNETEDIENNHGMCGVYSLTSLNGKFEFKATLQSKNPDSSDDDSRADQTLTVTVTRVGTDESVSSVDDYEYHGDEPGDHLLDEGVEALIDGLITDIQRHENSMYPTLPAGA